MPALIRTPVKLSHKETTHLQQSDNHTLVQRKFPWRKIRVDGVPGSATISAAGMAAYLMGFSSDEIRRIEHGNISHRDYEILTHQRNRTAAMHVRDRSRRPHERVLRRRHEQSLHPTYQMGGWGGTGAAILQREDQGNDFEIPLGNWITSPGHGEVVGHASDGPFPNGFGSPYAIVQITSGAFAIGNGEWYVGHCNADVKPIGTKLNPGDPIARANNFLNAGWGWCELGKWDGGPHAMGNGGLYRHLFVPVKL